MEQENNNFSEGDFSPLPEMISEEPEFRLVHSKVPFSPWISETCFFYRRYFKQFILLGLIAAFLSYGATYFNVKSAKANRENEVASDAADLKNFDLFTSLRVSVWKTEEEDSETDAAALDSGGEPAADDSAGESEPLPADDSEELEPDDVSEPSADFDFEESSFEENPASLPYSFFAVLSWIFSVMFFCWAIKTLKTDNGSFRNLLPFRWTFLKLIGSGILVSCIIACVGFVIVLLAAVLISAVSRIAGFGAVPFTAAVCLAGLWVVISYAVRYLLAAPLIIDQNVGVFQSLKMSKQFMRKNGSILLSGAVVYILAVLLLSLVIYLPLLFYFGAETFTSVEYHIYSLIVEGDTAKLRCLMSIAYVVTTIFTTSLMPAMSAVFYTMATGQCRPGAWERDSKSAGSADENKEV